MSKGRGGVALIAATIGALCIITACKQNHGGSDGSSAGGIRLGVRVTALAAQQRVCVTWKEYEQTNQTWALVDSNDQQVCGSTAGNEVSDHASCHDGQHFLVAYTIYFYDNGVLVGTAGAVSGGSSGDVCHKGTDVDSFAIVQFPNQGPGGGVNPALSVEPLCVSDKLQAENGSIVSAVWFSPPECTISSGAPSDFCAFGTGSGLSTTRTGLTTDNTLRYIFSDSGPQATWDAYYLGYPANTPTDDSILYLKQSPWALHHAESTGAMLREIVPGVITSFRFGDATALHAGFVQLSGSTVHIFYDPHAACDGPISLDAQFQGFPAPTCGSPISALGAVATGGSTFSLVFACGDMLTMVPCDATGTGGICNSCASDADCSAGANVAAVACIAGQCKVQSCSPGFADCDGFATNGCEADLNSVTSCGACGLTCAAPNGTPTCSNGICQVQSCNVPFADCNNSAADGCETNLANNVANCGMCGSVCNLPHTLVNACVNQTCTPAACQAGFANCNNSSVDGCEVDLMNDSNNCGYCGHSCIFSCSNGSCFPF
jgi:hypothetical protein